MELSAAVGLISRLWASYKMLTKYISLTSLILASFAVQIPSQLLVFFSLLGGM